MASPAVVIQLRAWSHTHTHTHTQNTHSVGSLSIWTGCHNSEHSRAAVYGWLDKEQRDHSWTAHTLTHFQPSEPQRLWQVWLSDCLRPRLTGRAVCLVCVCVCVLKTTSVHVLSSCRLSPNHTIKCTIPIPHWVHLSVIFPLFMWATKVLDIWKICTNVEQKMLGRFADVSYRCFFPVVYHLL